MRPRNRHQARSLDFSEPALLMVLTRKEMVQRSLQARFSVAVLLPLVEVSSALRLQRQAAACLAVNLLQVVRYLAPHLQRVVASSAMQTKDHLSLALCQQSLLLQLKMVMMTMMVRSRTTERSPLLSTQMAPLKSSLKALAPSRSSQALIQSYSM